MNLSLTIIVLLAAAVIAVAMLRRLRLPPLLAYLLLGILVGPYALKIISVGEETTYLAELGMVLLMFTIGLEFSLPQLYAMRRTVFGLGTAQVVGTMLAVALIVLLLGGDWRVALALGGAFAMSSTAIASKHLAEKVELKSTHGAQTMGTLLFQDLAVVPLLILIPTLVQREQASAWVVATALLKAAAVLLVILWGGRYVLRVWFHWVAKQRSSELFVLNVLFVTLGLAGATQAAGLSPALGAFLAGMLLSESEYRYQIEDYIKPFRDVLLGLFFVSIGMLFNVGILVERPLQVLAVLIVAMALKLALVVALTRWFGHSSGVALRTALAIAPAGEFGLVLLAQAHGLVNADWLQTCIAAMLLSMFFAPLLLEHSERLVLYVVRDEWMNRALQVHQLSVASMEASGHVIVCGYGRSGQNIVRLLAREGVQTMALDLDAERVRAAAAAGESVVFGDAARQEVLVAAGIHRAAAMIVSFADTAAATKILSHAHQLEPALPVIVRTFDDSDMEKLRVAGAAEVVPEVLEGSLMLATHALLLLGVPLSRVLKRLRDVRRERYQFMRAFFHGESDSEDTLEAAQPRLQSVLLGADAFAVGKRLRDLRLNDLDVEVTGLRRRHQRSVKPGLEMDLEANDVLVLLGQPENLALAEERLLQGD